MDVDFFVKQIAMNKDKDAYVDSKIRTQYIPYEEKISKIENIIRSTSIVKDDVTGIEIFKRNTPACNLLFNLTLIDLYTDIEIDFEHVLKDYNALEEKGFINLLLKHIPADEYISWQKLFDMIASDFMENERSLVSYLETRLGALDKTADSIVNVIKELEIENE